MNILNGRKTGDVFGKTTSFQCNGNGVADYVISSQDLFPRIPQFKFGDYNPWVSEHCPLLYKLNVKNTLLPNEDDLMTEMLGRFNALEEIDESDRELLVSGITTTL